MMCSNAQGNVFDYEYFLQPNVCRFCWSLDGEKEIFENKIEDEAVSSSGLINLVKDLLDIHFVRDNGPEKICCKCCHQIQVFGKFKASCQESDRKLRKILQDGKIKTELTESTEFLNLENDSNLGYDLNFEFEQIGQDRESVSVNKKSLQKKKAKLKDPNSCELCLLVFRSKLELKRHKSLIHKCCSTCAIEFQSVDDLKAHNLESHGIETNSYKCFGCVKIFRTNRLRCRHELNFCKGLKDGYKCHICDRYLPTRKVYEVHMKDHRHNTVTELPENIFKCSKCHETFKTRELLNGHNEANHNVKKKFVCETCGRSFTRSDYLTKHRLTHTGVKKHKCKYCPFRASQRSSILVHMRRHTGERPYSCDICSQRCVSSSNLQAHRRRHLGTDKFECTLCDKKFGYKSSLEEHIESSHDRPQSHVCTACGATYSRIRGLKRHLTAKHGNQTKTSNENSEKAGEKSESELYIKMVNEDTVSILTNAVGNKIDIIC